MAVLWEYFNTGDNSRTTFWGANWKAQSFTVGAVGHTVTSVKLKLSRNNNPDIITVSIRAADVNGKPTGSDLTSGTTNGNTLTENSAGEWREITLTEYTLLANTKYAIVARALTGDSSNYVFWRIQTSDGYANGIYCQSSDSGLNWSTFDFDLTFEVWGNSLSTLQTVSDSLGLSDAVSRNKSFVIADASSLADSVLRNKTLAITDSVGANDAVLGNKSPLIVADSVSLSELINVITVAIIKTVTDAIGASDTALINKTAVIADAVNLLEQVFRHKPAVYVADVVYATEIILTTKLLTIGDSVNLAEVGAVLKTLNVPDTLTLVDAASTPSRILHALDSLSLGDNNIVNKVLQVTETINLVETIQVGVGSVKKTKLFLILGDLAVQLTGE